MYSSFIDSLLDPTAQQPTAQHHHTSQSTSIIYQIKSIPKQRGLTQKN